MSDEKNDQSKKAQEETGKSVETHPVDKGGEESTSAEKPALSGKFADLIKSIENLTVLELSELVKVLEDRFGISASAPTLSAAPSATGQKEEEDEGPSLKTVLLKETGAKKINVIKAIREILPDLGLKEAKDMADSPPKTIKESVPKDEAMEAKKKLEEAGATVELQ